MEAARSVWQRRSYRPGVDPVPIDELVSPLRYDILVRAEYFTFFAKNIDLFTADFPAFEAQARRHAYYTWFTTVALVRYRPGEAADRHRLEDAFRVRLRRSAELYTGFMTDGFDLRYPISLRTATPGARTQTGKEVRRPVHAGDGCHRLALLVQTGAELLPPSHYRVRTDPMRELIDNTALLVPALGLSDERYFSFLARGYVERPCRDEEALIAAVRDLAPRRLPELERVLDVDRRLRAQPPTPSRRS